VSEPTTVLLQRCIDRLISGDGSAREELLRHACKRLEHLTRKMLQDFPRLRRWEQTGDVLSNASLRLWKALSNVQPETVRDFFALAAVQMRRELIDLTRHHFGPQGAGAHHASAPPHDPAKSSSPADLADPADDDTSCTPERLEAWSELHARIEQLSPEAREVFSLMWYHGLKQDEVAEVLNLSVRTVKRYWRSARIELGKWLRDRNLTL
jgi:RNA polymerase sigma-70 factor (ECF subfamily)